MARSRKRSRTLPKAPAGQAGTLRLGVVLMLLVGVNLYVFLWRKDTSVPAMRQRAALSHESQPLGTAASGAGETASAPTASATPTADESADGAGDERGKDVEHKVQRGDSLGRILKRENLDSATADQVLRALRPHMDFRKIRAGQIYRIRYDDGGRLVGFEFQITSTKKALLERGPDGTLTGRATEAKTDVRVEEVGGTVAGSLYKSMKRAGEDTRLVAFMVDVFAYDLNFYVDTHKGDTFRMLVEKEYLEGKFLRYRRVLAAEYKGKAGTFRAVGFKTPGKRGKYRFFDQKGRGLERLLLKTPLKFARVSSRFNRRRMHPVLHRVRAHLGIDFAARTGTPVRAAAEGKIVFRGRRGGGGNVVILQHANGLQTLYFHLSKFRKGQRVGTRVTPKKVIGYVGTTGLSTGPHLHFSVKKNGSYVDPMKMKMTRYSGIARRYRARFLRATAPILRRLAAISTAPTPDRNAAADAAVPAASPQP